MKRTPTDNGHRRLREDVSTLLDAVDALDFHDFKGDRYATPKVELVRRLGEMLGNAQSGTYDNPPDEEDRRALSKLLDKGLGVDDRETS